MARPDGAVSLARTASVATLARRLRAALGARLDAADLAALPPDDPSGVWLPGDGRPVARLAWRVEPGAPPYAWAREADAVLLHRPFGLWPARWPRGVAVLAAHAALDAWLWTAARPALADALGVVSDGEPLARDGRRTGVVGAAPADALDRLAALVGRPEAVLGEASRPVERLAVVGAMTNALVREAAARGATHYVTGQVRRPGLAAAEATGIVVVATGQHAAEAWALGALARTLAGPASRPARATAGAPR